MRFTDRQEDGDGLREFRYEGHVPSLHQYLIGGTYWESGDYRFVDQRTGAETAIFTDYPHLSPDGRYIISLYANPYETTADLELYTISGNTVKPLITASFAKWMPVSDPQEIFWNSDGWLYMPVNHTDAYWKEDGSLNDQFQYLRIRPHLQKNVQ